MAISSLDYSQVIRTAFDETNGGLKVKAISGGLVTEPFDYLTFTYVTSGNGIGEIQTITYKSGGASGTLVAILTLTYDVNNKLSSVTKA